MDLALHTLTPRGAQGAAPIPSWPWGVCGRGGGVVLNLQAGDRLGPGGSPLRPGMLRTNLVTSEPRMKGWMLNVQ